LKGEQVSVPLHEEKRRAKRRCKTGPHLWRKKKPVPCAKKKQKNAKNRFPIGGKQPRWLEKKRKKEQKPPKADPRRPKGLAVIIKVAKKRQDSDVKNRSGSQGKREEGNR